jgi:hypothetical protein
MEVPTYSIGDTIRTGGEDAGLIGVVTEYDPPTPDKAGEVEFTVVKEVPISTEEREMGADDWDWEWREDEWGYQTETSVMVYHPDSPWHDNGMLKNWRPPMVIKKSSK